MKTAFRILCALALTLTLGLPLVYASGAASDTLTWVNPTTRNDGSALTNQASTLISFGPTAGGPYTGGTITVAFPGTIATNPRGGVNARGQICYVAQAVDAIGLISVFSNEVCKTVLANPSAPVTLTVS